MAFTRFTIKNFKCFRAQQELLFAIPEEGKIGSGITYIVGANNSGKTTLIEGMSIKDADKINSSVRVAGEDPEFELYDAGTLKRKCVLLREESHTIKEDPVLLPAETFYIVSSRRHWESRARNTYAKVGDSFADSQKFLNRQNTIQVASELKTIEGNNTDYKNFIELVQRVIPEFTKFAVGYEEQEYIEYISGSGVRHKTDLLGDGVITVIRILLQLFVDSSSPIIIDEPELSLHPAAQKKLLNVLADYSQRRQIIISTHSPYFINWDYLENGAVVNRIVKPQDKDSKVYSINDFSGYSGLLSGENWQQPFLLDEVAKEIFFAEDNILFLEGQEDVGLLRGEAQLSTANIFGYGVRGKDNFQSAMQLAKDLGYIKVACLIDAGESETATKAELERNFPEYSIQQWNRGDIRDKEVYSSTEKVGYFTSRGAKKSEDDLEDFNDKLTTINSYFNGDEE